MRSHPAFIKMAQDLRTECAFIIFCLCLIFFLINGPIIFCRRYQDKYFIQSLLSIGPFGSTTFRLTTNHLLCVYDDAF